VGYSLANRLLLLLLQESRFVVQEMVAIRNLYRNITNYYSTFENVCITVINMEKSFRKTSIVLFDKVKLMNGVNECKHECELYLDA